MNDLFNHIFKTKYASIVLYARKVGDALVPSGRCNVMCDHQRVWYVVVSAHLSIAKQADLHTSKMNDESVK